MPRRRPRLEAQTAGLGSEPLSAAKEQLRSAVIITRDSLVDAVATAALIVRAQSTKSVGVEHSQARRLRGQCLAAQRSTATTLTAIAALNTPDPKGEKLLRDYRAALTEVGRRMGECGKALGVSQDAQKSLTSARINTAVSEVRWPLRSGTTAHSTICSKGWRSRCEQGGADRPDDTAGCLPRIVGAGQGQAQGRFREVELWINISTIRG